MADVDDADPFVLLEDVQHWTWVIGRAQQMLIEFATRQMLDPERAEQGRQMLAQLMQPHADALPALPQLEIPKDPGELVNAQAELWTRGFEFWGGMMKAGLDGLQAFIAAGPEADSPGEKPARPDRRFAHEAWQSHPLFAAIRRSYEVLTRHMLTLADQAEGVSESEREQLRFNARALAEALSPTNYPMTNPAVIERAIETRGESLLKGLEHLLRDLSRGQLTHTDPDAFEVGRDLATTPGKVVHETPLYQLIQYSPSTAEVLTVPLIVFPPWINRFYILDLRPEKSFVKWAVDQGLTVFMVSWRSADASMEDVVWDDYVAAQIDALEAVQQGLGVDRTHLIGYCVAGTTLAATLAVLAARGEQDKVASATFFTAQVDFSEAGDLKLFTSDQHLAMIDKMSEAGFLDGRYMAATFNALRGQDLVWNYVVHNYLMGEDYPTFDLLHWNGDTTNLPHKWHRSYLRDLYRGNRLVEPGGMTVLGTPIDLSRIKTPAYIQAGREDHIAPASSVWKLTRHLSGPKRFVLAGSGHIAGVVNPPAAGKYQHWVNDDPEVSSLDEFLAGAREVKGSWWPDWIGWLRGIDDTKVPAKGARIPGQGPLEAIEDAPGRYVRQR